MTLILKVTSTNPQVPLSQLLELPLGLDVWEVKPDHVVLRAAEPQAERLQRMGYRVEQLHLTDTYLSTFATEEAIVGYHSAASLEQDMRQLATSQPQIVELRELGRVGSYAFSEPETRAVRDLIARELFRGVITYHSFSQLILYPWGYTSKPIAAPASHNQMVELAQRMQKLIRDVHDVSYTPEQSSQLYPTAGDTTDWTYGIYQIPSFTTELRPHTQAEGGFILPPGQIQPTWEENQPAALEFIQHVL